MRVCVCVLAAAGGDASRHCPCSKDPAKLRTEHPCQPQEGSHDMSYTAS